MTIIALAAKVEELQAQLAAVEQDRDRLTAELERSTQDAVTAITEDIVLCHVALIDISDSLRRQFGSLEKASDVYGRPIPEHDFRWHLTAEDGAETTFHRGATADDVAADLKRRAAEPSGTEAGQ